MAVPGTEGQGRDLVARTVPSYRQCTACGFAISDRELNLLATARETKTHAVCMDGPRQKRFTMRLMDNARCLFCGMTGLGIPGLIDHFAREHGSVVVNW